LRLIGLAGAAMLALLAGALLAKCIGSFVLALFDLGARRALGVVYRLHFYFFRDPDPVWCRPARDLVIAPGHGKVDVIDTTTETEFMGGECQRISIFLSVIDIHVQCAPVAGRIAFFRHTPGQYLARMKTDSARFNRNVLIGLDT